MYNDHTDAEYDRREHAYELGALTPGEIAFERWSDAVVSRMLNYGITTGKQGLDGDQEADGFSLDFASDRFDAGAEPDDYFMEVVAERKRLGFQDASL